MSLRIWCVGCDQAGHTHRLHHHKRRRWLNSNATLRNLTQQRADDLSARGQISLKRCTGFIHSIGSPSQAVLRDLASTQTYQNFKLRFFPNPIEEIIKDWQASGRQAYELIEPSDGSCLVVDSDWFPAFNYVIAFFVPSAGFHPNQLAQTLIVEHFFRWASADPSRSELIPEHNPHNDDIARVFGDQGGY